MKWNAIFGIACIVSLTAPIAVIIYHRYYKHRSLAALLIYYTVTAIYLLMSENIIPVTKSIRVNFGIFNNYLDVPLMLTALVFFCPNKPKQNIIRLLSYTFIAFELLVTLLWGFNLVSIVYIMGPGFVIIIGYTFYLFMRQVKFSIMHRKNHGRVIMLASIFFSYACYALIYYFYYVQKTPYVNDTELIYFISTIISTIVMATGLQLMNRRMRELQSLKITRRELAMFFNH
jgi:hypothetical protein